MTAARPDMAILKNGFFKNPSNKTQKFPNIFYCVLILSIFLIIPVNSAEESSINAR